KARKLLKRAKKALKQAEANATRAAMGKKLSSDCAAALKSAADGVLAGLGVEPLTREAAATFCSCCWRELQFERRTQVLGQQRRHAMISTTVLTRFVLGLARL